MVWGPAVRGYGGWKYSENENSMAGNILPANSAHAKNALAGTEKQLNTF